MAVRHMSISVSEEVEQLIRAAAESAGMSVSTWLSEVAQRAAAEQAAIADGRAAVAEYEAEYGLIPREGRERACYVLLDAGDLAPSAQRTVSRSSDLERARNDFEDVRKYAISHLSTRP